MQKIAAIDAGSNAIRMIVGNVNETWQVEPIENIRLPVRLGQDVFASGSLREKTIQQATDAFLHFQRVAQDLGVEKTRAIATSAMREAANSDILLDRISRTSGIEIEIISGAEEARLIHLAVANVDQPERQTRRIDRYRRRQRGSHDLGKPEHHLDRKLQHGDGTPAAKTGW